MAEKDSSTRLSAPAATQQATQAAGRDEQPKKSQQATNADQPHLAHSDNDQKREESMEPPRPSDLRNTPRGMLDRSLQAQLGRQLRAIFSDVEQEPVPERFVKLLEALEAREKRR
jgi:hypothetical protein